MLGWFYLARPAAGLHAVRAAHGADPRPASSPATAADITTGRAFALSLTYVLGMALTYTVAGVAVPPPAARSRRSSSRRGSSCCSRRCSWCWRCRCSACSRCRCRPQSRPACAQLSNRQSAGTFGGVAIMGALSALIVTTCVAPALVAALLVIGQSGQIARGGGALFAMSLGMGTPLLIVGASAGRLPAEGRTVDGHREETVRRGDARRRRVDARARAAGTRGAVAVGGAGAGAGLALVARGARPRGIRAGAARRRRCRGPVCHGARNGRALGGTDPLAPIPALASHARACRSSQSDPSRISTRLVARPGAGARACCSISTPTGASRARRWSATHSRTRACGRP